MSVVYYIVNPQYEQCKLLWVEHTLLREDLDQGIPLRDRWRGITTHLDTLDDTSEEEFLLADILGVPDAALALSPAARASLEDLIAPHVELLPAQCSDVEASSYMIVNVLTVLDIWDRERSTFTYVGKARIPLVERRAFRPVDRRGAHIFRVAGIVSTVYVSAAFVDRVRETRLTGLDFKPSPLVGPIDEAPAG